MRGARSSNLIISGAYASNGAHESLDAAASLTKPPRAPIIEALNKIDMLPEKSKLPALRACLRRNGG